MAGNNNTVHGSDVRTTTSREKLLETMPHDLQKSTRESFREENLWAHQHPTRTQARLLFYRCTPTLGLSTQSPDGGALARGGAHQLLSKPLQAQRRHMCCRSHEVTMCWWRRRRRHRCFSKCQHPENSISQSSHGHWISREADRWRLKTKAREGFYYDLSVAIVLLKSYIVDLINEIVSGR